MKNCMKCGKEYILHSFSLDSGYCDDCKPGFFSLPELRKSTPAETKSLIYSMICINIILSILSSMILDCGEISTPGMFFFGLMAAFWTYELIHCNFSPEGFPALTLFQRLMIILSPFYGFPAFITIWLLIRALVFKECR